MAIDWYSVIEEQQVCTDRMTRNVIKLLLDPAASINRISSAHQITTRRTQEIDDLYRQLQDDADAPLGYLLAIEILQDVWRNLAVVTEGKMRAMQGLPPLYNPDNNEH